MARTRQKAKQRKARRLEQERKAAERSQGPGVDAQTAEATDEALAEVEDAQLEAAAELAEAQEVEVGAGAEAARHAAGVEAAAAAEAATTGEVAPVDEVAPVEEDGVPAKPTRRERRTRREAREAEQPRKPATTRTRERARTRDAARKEPRRRGRVLNFFVQCWAELRRVQWPNRNQVTQATAVVIVFCLVAGAYLGIWDFVFNRLVRAIL